MRCHVEEPRDETSAVTFRVTPDWRSTDIIENRRMEPIVYVTDDPAIWKELPGVSLPTRKQSHLGRHGRIGNHLVSTFSSIQADEERPRPHSHCWLFTQGFIAPLLLIDKPAPLPRYCPEEKTGESIPHVR